MVTLYRGKTVDGPNKEDVIPPIDKKYFMYSISSDIKDAQTAIIQSPVYYSLNLCRALYYFREGVIASKLEGGKWAKQIISDNWKPLINLTLDHYQQKLTNPSWDQEHLVNFATYMLKKIGLE
ncbi:hypothetical protein J32TS6_09060 [Virgibacillus pantothenticus]|uniref:DUF4111 domain-containing protein n=1 Tax=Virgibacillus TaxID=84406 RepID=UPI000934D691|nr:MULTISPECIES: DUF4111 domain-containing protein [Virgibacillus]MBS7429952.1 DUF4111 domain-containing protein [Virgibacillus sp. 19R1-5]MBU8564950.1 DUF4111 domain-containing protein [Virgibacillus pantothenticus]MBU8599258.1 DUF4111 domain-containing protein [Virgibacillus pantothenticus]MBU8633339.1 DUF4111 domain-containing protein [Virgibacillus pantothenticus]MBU8641000.1 DUF4111 domain-containing protein [Virgibacillus pantothenticus]